MGRLLAITGLLAAALLLVYYVALPPDGGGGEPLSRTDDGLTPAGRGPGADDEVELVHDDPGAQTSSDGRERAGIRRRAVRVRKRFVETTELMLADKRTIVSGHELESEAPGIQSVTTRTLQFVDDYSSAEGAVDGIARTFEIGKFECVLDTTYHRSTSRESRVVNQVLPGESAWVGERVQFEWDGEARRYVARTDAESELDPSRLEGDTDFAFLAPPSGRKTWTVDAERLAPLLAPGGDPQLVYTLPEGPALNTGAFAFNAAACSGRLSGEATLTRGSKIHEKGRELLELQADFNLTSKRDGTRDAKALFGTDARFGSLRDVRLELTWAARGTIYWDTDQGCVTSFSLSGPSRVVAEADHETEMQGELIKSSVAFEMAGSTTLELETTELD